MDITYPLKAAGYYLPTLQFYNSVLVIIYFTQNWWICSYSYNWCCHTSTNEFKYPGKLLKIMICDISGSDSELEYKY